MVASDVTRVLDELVATLEGKAGDARDRGRADAIDAVLASRVRTTDVKSLREAPEVVSFRTALTDGLIRADTANQLLRLVQALVARLV